MSRRLFAHAFGERYDLPIPLFLFVLGGAAVVVLSFVLVLRRGVDDRGRTDEVDRAPRTPVGTIGSRLGLIVLATLVAIGLWGSNEVPENIVPTLFWLLAWIVVPLSCGLLGDWTRPVNPFAAVVRLVDHPGLRRAVLARAKPLRYPDRLGWWPAVVLYFSLACGELIYNLTVTKPHVIAIGLLVYAVLTAVAGVLFGATWLQRGEVFSVLYNTWGRLGWWRFGAGGRRGFAGGLESGFERATSRVVFVMLLLVTVNFDGLIATPQWDRWEQGRVGADQGALEVLRLVTLVGLTVVVCAVFGAFALAAARAGGHRTRFRDSLSGLLPSLLPIAFGYLVAHNAQYVLVNSQLLLPLIGNPVGRESWPLHLPYPFTDSYEVSATFLPSAVYWYVGIAAIIAAHVVAVVLAHRHLTLRGADRQRGRASEYPWLVAMVAYTMFSLVLIAQPLVTEVAA